MFPDGITFKNSYHKKADLKIECTQLTVVVSCQLQLNFENEFLVHYTSVSVDLFDG